MLILLDLLANAAGVGHGLGVGKHGCRERGSVEEKHLGRMGSAATISVGLASTNRSVQAILRVVIADRNGI